MRSPAAGTASVQNLFAVAPADHGAGSLVAIAPAADANHFVVFHPLRESIVRRVNADEAAAVLDEILERGLGCGTPISAVVVENDDAVFGEVRLEIVHALAVRRAGGDVHGESSGAFEGGLEDRGRDLPLVIILAIDDQGLELVSGGGGLKTEKEQRAQRQAGQPIDFNGIYFHIFCDSARTRG